MYIPPKFQVDTAKRERERERESQKLNDRNDAGANAERVQKVM